jgi:hypothetical protein
MSETREGQRFWGKYRGSVANNIDPDQRGRMLLQVPDVFGVALSSWAEPCVPLAGPTGPPMGVYLVPPIGTGVWVEFEHGDPDYPIWVGCRWGTSSDVPLPSTSVPVSPDLVLQSLAQHFISISGMPAPNGITLQTVTQAKITIDATGITLDNGLGAKIELKGPMVSINNSALTVI